MALPLSPQVFAIVAHLIEDATGLHYDVRDASLLAEKLTVRASELELGSLLDYYYFLRYDAAGARELDALVELLVVNETYFFREADQLRTLVERLVPPVLQRKDRVRIWCAASSTGEEPLTLAMMLRDAKMADRVEILATDISARVLAKARDGLYGGRSLRALPADARDRHFVDMGNGLVRVKDEIRSCVQWQRVNLFDTERVSSLGRFDVILCRNALIYFRDESILALVHRFASCLPPGGLLAVGASESLLRFGTAFECEEHGGAFFYRRRAA
jgi:chemotaxis protein methyltransferase CheR